MKTHQNSLLSYWSSGATNSFNRREQLCIAAYRKLGSATDREVMVACGFAEMNCVRPRISNLIDLGVAVEVGSVTCPVTKKTVRRVQLAQAQPEAQFTMAAILVPDNQRRTA